MLSLPRTRALILVSALLIGLMSAGQSQGQAVKGKNFTFNSHDGVELSGTLYANSGGKRDAVVLLIPNFDLRKGGGIQQQGWSDLAKALHKDGYSVFSFDFRGFGASKTINTATFWAAPHNLRGGVRKRMVNGKPSDQIDYKDFALSYLPNLVNDIAAAKAFLDRENDRKVVNTSNLILIGAGHGATLGAMWLANESRRCKDTAPLGVGIPRLGEPEIKSVAGAVWLSIAPNLGGGGKVPLTSWIKEAGRANKIPMAFVFGKNDITARNLGNQLYNGIKANQPKKDFELTLGHAVPGTKLAGNQLLQSTLDTETWILNKFLDPVMSKRGNKQQVVRDVTKSRYFYITANGAASRLNKAAGDEVPPVDTSMLTPIFR